MGRRSKLTPEVQEKVVMAIRGGNYAATAAAYAGIDESTFYRWLQQGEQAGSGKYHEFCKAVKEASAAAETRNVALVSQAAGEAWQAAAWWLERRFPDRWGRRKLELSGPDGQPIAVEQTTHLSVKDRAARVAELLAAAQEREEEADQSADSTNE